MSGIYLIRAANAPGPEYDPDGMLPRLSLWSAAVKWSVGNLTKRISRRRDANPSEGLDRYGPTLFADPTNKKYPIDTPGRIQAAWAYIHQPNNAAKYTPGERRTIISRIRRAAKARRVALPDPDEFVKRMARVRRQRRGEEE